MLFKLKYKSKARFGGGYFFQKPETEIDDDQGY